LNNLTRKGAKAQRNARKGRQNPMEESMMLISGDDIPAHWFSLRSLCG
jgi:hypothetical protein